MKNFNRHNDLISNFFYLITNFFSTHGGIQKLEPYSYLDYMDETNLEGSLSVEEWELNNFPDKIKELKELIAREIKKGYSLETLKNRIISTLKEIEYRIDLPYTINIKVALLYYFSYSTNDVIELMANSINEDIDWVNNLTEKDLENKKIILNSKLTKGKLVSTIIEILKGKYKFNEDINFEIKKFINYIADKKSSDYEYNLNFLKNNEIKTLAKIFFLLQFKGLIINENKGELTKILADCLNVSASTLNHSFKVKKLKKELESNSTAEAYLINELS